MTTTLVTDPGTARDHRALDHAAVRGILPADPGPAIESSLRVAADHQALAAAVIVARTDRAADPQAWLFAERARYLATGACDPYAQMLLRTAGMFPTL